MSVKDQTHLTEKRIVTVKQEGLLAPWFNDDLAVSEANCSYDTGGLVTVTFGPFYIADTLGTPIVLQIIGLPEMKFDHTNINPATPTFTWLCTKMTGFIDGIYTDISHASLQLLNDPRHILSNQLYDGALGVPFPANSEVYIFKHTFTYPWATLPDHAGVV